MKYSVLDRKSSYKFISQTYKEHEETQEREYKWLIKEKKSKCISSQISEINILKYYFTCQISKH